VSLNRAVDSTSFVEGYTIEVQVQKLSIRFRDGVTHLIQVCIHGQDFKGTVLHSHDVNELSDTDEGVYVTIK
jgi:VCBS repeat-containing protein